VSENIRLSALLSTLLISLLKGMNEVRAFPILVWSAQMLSVKVSEMKLADEHQARLQVRLYTH
jgi:hypothetical protein